MRKVVLAIIALALGLSACSSSGKTGSSSAAGANDSQSGGWCSLAKSYQDQSAEISKVFRNVDFTNPAKMKEQLASAFKKLRPKFKEMFDKAGAVLPDEIRSDFGILKTGFNNWLDALDAAGYDMEKMAKSPAMTAFSRPDFKAAGTHIGKYGEKHCGIPYTPAPAAT